MEQTLKIPEFKTEREEAQWWSENQDQVAQRFERAAAEGTLGRGTVVRRGKTPTTTIRLDPEDIKKARFYAQREGLKYQTYLKMLIRQALQWEELRGHLSTQDETGMISRTPRPSHAPRRSRNEETKTRKKREDILVGTLRDKYGENFAKGYRSDTKLGTVLEREGLENLGQLLKKKGR
jgi:predicted DNA binding CopG/RHH family protein